MKFYTCLKTMLSFKPYYKWIVLNTKTVKQSNIKVFSSFKPYYKWIVLNTQKA